MYVDCREFPSERGCTVALSADSEEELLEAACQHAVAVHGETDTPELRKMIRQGMHTGTPPVELTRARQEPAGTRSPH
jgi:predicted small metal-binding protein